EERHEIRSPRGPALPEDPEQLAAPLGVLALETLADSPELPDDVLAPVTGHEEQARDPSDLGLRNAPHEPVERRAHRQVRPHGVERPHHLAVHACAGSESHECALTEPTMPVLAREHLPELAMDAAQVLGDPAVSLARRPYLRGQAPVA